MSRKPLQRAALLLGGFLGLWLFLQYLLPIVLPFLLGLLLALAAEPGVRFGTGKLKLPRWAATGISVTLTLALLIALAGILGAAAVKELGVLAGQLPDLQTTADNAVQHLRSFLESAAARTPAGVRPLVDRSITRLFSSGSVLVEQATVRLPGTVSAFLSRLPDGALSIGTGILSGFMLSARLPQLKAAAREKLPEQLFTQVLPKLKQSKKALSGWIKAQCRLSAITWSIVTVGFLLLRIPYAPLWAVAVALVDAVPLLGTGTMLLPWALVCLLQQAHFRSVGLLCIYAAAVLTRTVLEPRLVGRHLGIDPLLTLLFLYLGYRFWGILGMLLAPMLAAAFFAAGKPQPEQN